MVQQKGASSSTSNSHQARAPNQKRKQAHQNTFKFKHNKNSKKTNLILALPIHGVCESCYKILKWRKDFRKYKPLTQPRRCNFCQQKTVKSAYHVICDACCEDKKVCSKCLQPKSIYEPTEEERAEEMAGEDGEEGDLDLEEVLSQLPMRKQKTVMRKLEKGEKLKDVLETIHFDTVIAQRRQRRQENGLDFDDDEDDEVDEDEEDELEEEEDEDEEEKPVKSKSTKDSEKSTTQSTSLVDDLLSIEKELQELQVDSKPTASTAANKKQQEEEDEEEEESFDDEEDFDEDEEEDL